MKKNEENTTPIEDVEEITQNANCESEITNGEEVEVAAKNVEDEITATEVEPAAEATVDTIKTETQEKPKLTFDQKVDKVATFIKKYKIAILCGLIAIVALVVGIAIGGAFGGSETSDESGYTASQGVESEDENTDTYISTPTPTTSVTESPTATSSVSTGSSVAESPSSTGEETQDSAVEEVTEPTTKSVYYSDLLTTPVYFDSEIQIDMQESDLIELLNNVLEENDEVVSLDGEEGKTPISDNVSVEVTKAEMLNLLQDTSATFVSIDQSVSGNILTLDVDMNLQIPDEIYSEYKTALFLLGISSNLSFSYTVSYEMDGEQLIPIELSDSTISIAGQSTSVTEKIAGYALSSYSDASSDVLLLGYNNMAGEIIADILNNYGRVTGASSSVISVTTRTE